MESVVHNLEENQIHHHTPADPFSWDHLTIRQGLGRSRPSFFPETKDDPKPEPEWRYQAPRVWRRLDEVERRPCVRFFGTYIATDLRNWGVHAQHLRVVRVQRLVVP